MAICRPGAPTRPGWMPSGRFTDHLRDALPRVLEAEGYDGLVPFELDPVDGDSDRAARVCRQVFGF